MSEDKTYKILDETSIIKYTLSDCDNLTHSTINVSVIHGKDYDRIECDCKKYSDNLFKTKNFMIEISCSHTIFISEKINRKTFKDHLLELNKK